MANRLFVDTWAWLVLANDRDPAFERLSAIRALAARERTLWVTTDYVLDESSPTHCTLPKLIVIPNTTWCSRPPPGTPKC